MKILIVSHSCAVPANQGLYVALQDVANAEVTLAIPARWKDEFGNTLDETPRPELAARTLKIPVLANGNIILHVYRKNWSALLRRERFDAIYVNHEPYALATAQLCRANLRQAKPAVFGFYSCQNIAKAYPFPVSRFETMVYKQSAFAFPITNAVADVLRGKGFGGEVTVCPLPFDPENYHPRGVAADHALVPRRPGEMVIGYVGRLVPAKGLRTLAAALAKVRDLPWKLVLVGAGELENELRTTLRRDGLLERTTFAGFVPHNATPGYLSAFDVLVLPSETQPNWKEQFGRVIVESLACGTPVIGSDSGEIPVLIRESGGGEIFPERDPARLADAVRAFHLHPERRETMARCGRKWALDRFSIATVAERMAGALQQAVSRSAHGATHL